MSDYDPSALRRVAERVASSPGGVFPGVGILAYTGVVQAALRWANREQAFMATAQVLGAAESEARTLLDRVVADRLARGLDVDDEDTFRVARSRLYRSMGWTV